MNIINPKPMWTEMGSLKVCLFIPFSWIVPSTADAKLIIGEKRERERESGGEKKKKKKKKKDKKLKGDGTAKDSGPSRACGTVCRTLRRARKPAGRRVRGRQRCARGFAYPACP